MGTLHSLVSDGNQTPSFFPCRSWEKVSELPFSEEMLSNRAESCRSQDLQGCSSSSEECALLQTLSSARLTISLDCTDGYPLW